MEGERLGDKQAEQFVETAKALANEALESSSSEINSYLDGYQDTLPDSFKSSLKKRIPEKFDIKENNVKPKLPKGTTDNGDGTFTLPTGQVIRKKQ